MLKEFLELSFQKVAAVSKGHQLGILLSLFAWAKQCKGTAVECIEKDLAASLISKHAVFRGTKITELFQSLSEENFKFGMRMIVSTFTDTSFDELSMMIGGFTVEDYSNMVLKTLLRVVDQLGKQFVNDAMFVNQKYQNSRDEKEKCDLETKRKELLTTAIMAFKECVVTSIPSKTLEILGFFVLQPVFEEATNAVRTLLNEVKTIVGGLDIEDKFKIDEIRPATVSELERLEDRLVGTEVIEREGIVDTLIQAYAFVPVQEYNKIYISPAQLLLGSIDTNPFASGLTSSIDGFLYIPSSIKLHRKNFIKQVMFHEMAHSILAYRVHQKLGPNDTAVDFWQPRLKSLTVNQTVSWMVAQEGFAQFVVQKKFGSRNLLSNIELPMQYRVGEKFIVWLEQTVGYDNMIELLFEKSMLPLYSEEVGLKNENDLQPSKYAERVLGFKYESRANSTLPSPTLELKNLATPSTVRFSSS